MSELAGFVRKRLCFASHASGEVVVPVPELHLDKVDLSFECRLTDPKWLRRSASMTSAAAIVLFVEVDGRRV